MVKLFTHPDLSFIQHLRLLLESHGITTAVRNEYIQGGKGAFPLTETWPELWLSDVDRVEQANAVLKSALVSDAAPTESWQCAQCGEAVEGQFTECWNCGHSRQ